MTNDTLADALNIIKTHEFVGKTQCMVRASKLVREILKILQTHNYVGDFEFVDDGKSGFFKINLLGRINKCGVIKPRFPVKKADWNQWEEQFIPGVGFGLLIVSTPKGMMTNTDAKENETGGRLIAYVY